MVGNHCFPCQRTDRGVDDVATLVVDTGSGGVGLRDLAVEAAGGLTQSIAHDGDSSLALRLQFLL